MASPLKFDPVIRQSSGPLVDALAAAGADVRKPRSMRCPFHDDKHPSAGIRQGKDGAWRFYCYACQSKGLDVYDVRKLAGLDGSPVPRPEAPRAKATAAAPVKDWESFHAGLLRATSDTALSLLSNSLGVSVPSLRRIAAAWYPPSSAWCFPMRDSTGTIIGLRLRNEAGQKFAVAGSQNGLFFAEGGLGDEAEQVFVCEGPTGLAALLDMNLEAVGRPSCSAYVEETVKLLAGRDVVIVADHDEAKKRKDGSVFYPGPEGAEVLAAALYRKASRVRIIQPLVGKDARDALRAGTTAGMLLAIAGSTAAWKPSRK